MKDMKKWLKVSTLAVWLCQGVQPGKAGIVSRPNDALPPYPFSPRSTVLTWTTPYQQASTRQITYKKMQEQSGEDDSPPAVVGSNNNATSIWSTWDDLLCFDKVREQRNDEPLSMQENLQQYMMMGTPEHGSYQHLGHDGVFAGKMGPSGHNEDAAERAAETTYYEGRNTPSSTKMLCSAFQIFANCPVVVLSIYYIFALWVRGSLYHDNNAGGVLTVYEAAQQPWIYEATWVYATEARVYAEDDPEPSAYAGKVGGIEDVKCEQVMHNRPHSNVRYPLWYGTTISPRLWADIGSGMSCTFGSVMPAENILSQSPPDVSIEAQAVNLAFAQPLEEKDCGAAVTCNQQVLPGLRQSCEHKVDNEADLLAWAKYKGRPASLLGLHGEYYGDNTTGNDQQFERAWIKQGEWDYDLSRQPELWMSSAQCESDSAYFSCLPIGFKSESSRLSHGTAQHQSRCRYGPQSAINILDAPVITRYGPDEQEAIYCNVMRNTLLAWHIVANAPIAMYIALLCGALMAIQLPITATMYKLQSSYQSSDNAMLGMYNVLGVANIATVAGLCVCLLCHFACATRYAYGLSSWRVGAEAMLVSWGGVRYGPPFSQHHLDWQGLLVLLHDWNGPRIERLEG